MSQVCRLMVLVGVTLAGIGSAQAMELNRVAVGPGTEAVSLDARTQYLRDETGQLTLDDVSAGHAQLLFQPLEGPSINMGFTGAVYWYRVELFNTAATGSGVTDWILEASWPPLDHVDVYVLGRDGPPRVTKMGRQQPPGVSGIAHRNHAMPLRLEPQVPVALYLRIQIAGAHQAPLHLWSATAFARKTALENLRFGMIYGILLVMVLYNLLIFIAVRDWSYLFYLLFVLALGGVQLSLDGFLHPLLWHLARPLVEESIPILIALAAVFGSLFVQTSLETRRHNPRLHILLRSAVAIGVFGVFLTAALTNLYSTFVNAVLGAIVALTCAAAVLRQSLQGRRTAQLYLFAWSLLLIGVLAKVLEVNALIPISPYTVYALHIGLCFLVTLLSLALAERINQERRLRARTTREHAARELAAKNEFLAKMSHELRTPMNAIVGFTNLALRDVSESRRIGHLGEVDVAAQAMRGILDDVFDLSQIDMGRLKLDRREFLMQALLERVSARIAPAAAERKLKWKITRADDVPEVLDGDVRRIEQVLVNLSENAVKFTERGEVELQVMVDARDTRSAQLSFAVRDTGIGIPPEQLARLFTPFGQGDQSTTRRYGGSGLGLVLSRQLAQLMDGDIVVRSRPGEGSEFRFKVALAVGESPAARLQQMTGPQSDPSPAYLQGSRVLLVEDNATNRRLACEILQGAGILVDMAWNGAEAIKTIARSSYDAILMDLQMPVMDGFEASRNIRALPGCQRLPIIAMTANAMAQDRSQAMASGMSDFIAKPIDAEQLLAVLAKWIKRPGTVRDRAPVPAYGVDGADESPAIRPAESVAASVSPVAEPVRILVVDDESINVRLLTEILASEGYAVGSARDGQQALDSIREARPHLVLLDVVMPDMSGYEVCEKLRANADTAMLPVVLVTGVRPEEERSKGLDAGADDFITKPVNREELLARVRSLLRVEALHSKVQAQTRTLAEWNEKLEARVRQQVGEMERLNTLRHFLPQQVAEMITGAGKNTLLEPKRRQVTVCVIDLRGFTAFTEASVPEEIVAVLREFYTEMGSVVERHSGTVEHFAGDSLTVFFNAPIEVEEPEVHAIRAAIGMRDAFAALGDRWARRGHELGLGIGLASGFATIGAIGFLGRWQYAAIGAVTNMAARLCGLAQHGEILAPAALIASVGGIVETEAVGERSLKGFARPVAVTRVLGIKGEAAAGSELEAH